MSSEATVERATKAAKARVWIPAGLIAAGLAAIGAFVALSGCTGVPTRTEQRFYDIETNLLPRVVWVTNVVEAGQEGQRSEVRGPVPGTFAGRARFPKRRNTPHSKTWRYVRAQAGGICCGMRLGSIFAIVQAAGTGR